MWTPGVAMMWNRGVQQEDPWISMTHVISGLQNDFMIYGEDGSTEHSALLETHGGLQVYALRKGNYQDCIVDGNVGVYDNGVFKGLKEKPYANCKAVLVRQTINSFHPASDSLAGNAEYGTAGVGNTFSLKYENWDFDTFIFATVDHQYFMAMTKEEVGGGLVTPNVFYANQERTFRYIDPDTDSWQQKSAKMYHRSSAREDPWLSINDHEPKLPNNKMMYGEEHEPGYPIGNNGIHLAAHGGLQVYILKEGTYQDCIVDGHIGYFENGVYNLHESQYNEYLGCFRDTTDRAFPFQAPKFKDFIPKVANANEYCMEKCDESGYTHYGLQNKYECFCGYDTYDKHGALPESSCNYKCRDQASDTICGGNWAMSVYKFK